jgi:hypothetical protein
MYQKKYLKWDECNILWDNMNYLWEDVFIEIHNIIKGGGGAGYDEYVKGNPWNKLKKDIGPEKTKKVIELYCNYKGLEYSSVSEVNESIAVTATDFELFITENIRESIKINISF